MDTKYLTIPRLVNEDRKDRFEKRIQAISYYASQADICRSRLLLSYFDENKTDDCGQCDVCLSQGKRDVSNESFEEIASSIKELLREEELLISTVIDRLQHHPPEKITATIRFLLDRGEVALRLDKIKLVVK